MKAVILAGGLGTRLREETEYRPKPMVEIGRRPILWHIMKNLSIQGIDEFIICAGYKSEFIKSYFLNYDAYLNDVTIKLGSKATYQLHNVSTSEKWSVTVVDTGLETMTGGRINKVKKFVGEETFLCTYGDGLADISLESLVACHNQSKTIGTVTAVSPANRFGALEINSDKKVQKFLEKPKSEQWVNGGFFIFEPGIFEYLDDSCILEKEPLENLAKDGELAAYKHSGFWQPMDTYRESQELNLLWSSNIAPWRNW